jgi:hypothetical protein
MYLRLVRGDNIMTNKYLEDEEKDLIKSYDNVNLTNLNKPNRTEQEEYIKTAKEFIFFLGNYPWNLMKSRQEISPA